MKRTSFGCFPARSQYALIILESLVVLANGRGRVGGGGTNQRQLSVPSSSRLLPSRVPVDSPLDLDHEIGEANARDLSHGGARQRGASQAVATRLTLRAM